MGREPADRLFSPFLLEEKAEAIRRARKLARKKMQREGLLPMKPRVVPGAGGAGGPGGGRGRGGPPRFGGGGFGGGGSGF
jgi:small subunit ribosomal protein S21